MGRMLRIRIDLSKLRQNLSTAQRHELSTLEVRQWLAQAGFTPKKDAWLVDDTNLGRLKPDEITSVEDYEPPER
jgi:hypothetical protein